MSRQPLVSIVLPTYNGERYLAQSIESCLAQTYSNIELLIVDDCSSDSTPRIIAAYAARDSRIRAIRNGVNRRLPASLNIGFADARGEYLTWTSDDNLYRTTAIAEMVSFLADGTADLVYADYSFVDEEGDELRRNEVGDPESLVSANCIGACFLYRRVVHERLGGYAEDLFLAEDYDFWLRSAAQFVLQPLHKDLYCHRVHPSSLSEQRASDVRKVAREVLARNLPQLLKGTDGLEAETRASTAASMVASQPMTSSGADSNPNCKWAWWALQSGHVRAARKHAFRALRRSPLSWATWRVMVCALRGY